MSANEPKLTDCRGKKKVLIFVVCYNAEESIESVLDRLPHDVWENPRYESEVLIIDDQSPDRTFDRADAYRRLHAHRNITVLYNPKNQGYGGNQKIGYFYAIEKGFDIVVLLHGDGQYAPEYLGQMIEPLLQDQADAVFGSRMLKKRDALKGGMPLYKWVGNQILTFIQNRLIKSSLSEFHSGYRAYSVKTLKSIPFEYNRDYFDFDTDIIIQLVDTDKRIKEIPIPTFYGDEICRVNGIKYAFRVVISCLRSRMVRMAIYYHPKFDYETTTGAHYHAKFGYSSSQQYAFNCIKPRTRVLDIGCGPGFMAEKLREKEVETISVDWHMDERTRLNSAMCIEADLEHYDFEDDFGKLDYITVLDVIEHLKSPERLLKILRRRFCEDKPEIIITTPNVSFLPVRLGMLFGSFNYGKRGVLDMDHARLFTFSSLQRTLQMNGYEITRTSGVPAPFPLALGESWLSRALVHLNRLFIFVWKGLFSYQIAVVVKPLPTLQSLLNRAKDAREERTNALNSSEG